MYTKQEIILRFLRDGMTIRAISRELGIHRKTVRKYLTQYKAVGLEESQEKGTLGPCLVQAPKYDVSNRSKLRLTSEVKKAIDELLEENEAKRQQGLGKQVLKKCDILECLHDRGFRIGYTSVCNYINIRLKELKPKEAFIRQEYPSGSVCEFDWGEIKLEINGELGRYYLAVFTSAYSNSRYAVVFARQDTLAFMESHVLFFAKISGVYQEMVYDNMRVAVARFVGNTEKEPTQALLQLRGHYHFSHRFCNIRRGNEKGHVERSIEYVRRKSFGQKFKFKTLKEANQWLEMRVDRLNNTQQQLTGKTATDLFKDEKPVLKSVSHKMLCSEMVQLRVDKYATISYKTNRYSVPDHLVGCFVEVKVMSHELQVYQGGSSVANHLRSYGKHQWIIKIDHYLETFRRKPGALAGSLALASSFYLKELFSNHFINDPRDFIGLIDYCRRHKITDQELHQTVEKLQNSGVRLITATKIEVLLGNKTNSYSPVVCTQTTEMAKSQLNQISSLFN